MRWTIAQCWRLVERAERADTVPGGRVRLILARFGWRTVFASRTESDGHDNVAARSRWTPRAVRGRGERGASSGAIRAKSIVRRHFVASNSCSADAKRGGKSQAYRPGGGRGGGGGGGRRVASLGEGLGKTRPKRSWRHACSALVPRSESEGILITRMGCH